MLVTSKGLLSRWTMDMSVTAHFSEYYRPGETPVDSNLLKQCNGPFPN